jgi:hypothetical protein
MVFSRLIKLTLVFRVNGGNSVHHYFLESFISAHGRVVKTPAVMPADLPPQEAHGEQGARAASPAKPEKRSVDKNAMPLQYDGDDGPWWTGSGSPPRDTRRV